MLVCPACAEDLGDDATVCTTCGSALPDWLTRLPLSTPPHRSSIAGWAIVVLGSLILFLEISGAIGWVTYLDTIHRR